MSHFLLNLQELSADAIYHSNPSTPSHVRSDVSTIRFNSVLGNIGAPLRNPSDQFDNETDIDVEFESESTEMSEMQRAEKGKCVDVSVAESTYPLANEFER